jgi:zinc/manganese transport system permease protein
MMYDWLLAPFVDYAFMRRALVAVLAVACASAPMGVFLVLRRMSLMADAMSHAIMPGVALVFVTAGLSLPLMSLGGFCAGAVVAVMAGLLTRVSALREDASFAALYLIALASGVMLISWHGSAVDLTHLLFGSVLAVDEAGLWLITGIASCSLLIVAMLYRPLVIAMSDPTFFASQGGALTAVRVGYLLLVTLNLVAGFQVLGTLMAVGMMLIPAITARFWAQHLDTIILLAALLGVVAGMCGLLLSYHASVAPGPAIILVAGGAYLISLLVGRYGSLRARYWPSRHLAH